MFIRVKEKSEQTRNVENDDNCKTTFNEWKKMQIVTIDFYINHKTNNKNIIDLYHVSEFFEFLMVVDSDAVSKKINIE